MAMTPDEYAKAVAERSAEESRAVANERAGGGGKPAAQADDLESRMTALVTQEGAVGTTFIDQCARAGDKGAGQIFNYLQSGRVLFISEQNVWLRWEGAYWSEIFDWEIAEYVEDVAEVYKRRRDMVFKLRLVDVASGDKGAIKEKDRLISDLDRCVSRLHNSRGPDNCLKFSLADRTRLSVRADKLDANPYIVATESGVVDIRSGELRPGRPEDFCTRHCPTAWTGIDTPCPKWETMLYQILGENASVYNYMHKLLGMAICGKVSEKNFLLLYGGEGDSGKTTIFEILYEIIKGYAAPMPVELLLDQGIPQNPNSPTPAIMGLRGQRLCWASEPGDNRRFSVERVKLMSGGDSLMGRYPYDKANTVFQPTHTLFMLSNHEPHAASTDSAFWKRLRKIDCPYEFVDDPKPNSNQRQANRNLKDEILEEESPGVLAWLVRGYQKYRAEGVHPPETIVEATTRYREQEDRVLQFKNDCIVDSPGNDVTGSDLYDVFRQWFERNHGRKVPSITIFGKMAARNFIKSRSSRVRYLGIDFNDECRRNFQCPEQRPIISGQEDDYAPYQ